MGEPIDNNLNNINKNDDIDEINEELEDMKERFSSEKKGLKNLIKNFQKLKILQRKVIKEIKLKMIMIFLMMIIWVKRKKIHLINIIISKGKPYLIR